MPRKSPDVNAGSMADIAFLLLIFFLVTTTIETDSGINRKLPPMEDQIDPPIIREKNIFTVVVNKYSQILVEEKLTDIKDIRRLAIDFLDNGGGRGEEACDYCQGDRNPRSSDNELRDREFKNRYPNEGLTYFEADFIYSDPRTTGAQKTNLKEKLDVVKKLYPQKLSEAEPSKVK